MKCSRRFLWIHLPSITVIDVEKWLNYDTFILNKCVPLRASQHLNLYLYHYFFFCAYVRKPKEENRSLYLYNFSSTFFYFVCYISCCFKSLCQFCIFPRQRTLILSSFFSEILSYLFISMMGNLFFLVTFGRKNTTQKYKQSLIIDFNQ